MTTIGNYGNYGDFVNYGNNGSKKAVNSKSNGNIVKLGGNDGGDTFTLNSNIKNDSNEPVIYETHIYGVEKMNKFHVLCNIVARFITPFGFPDIFGEGPGIGDANVWSSDNYMA